MNAPFIPNDAPFSEEQKSWLAGFLAGVQSRSLFDVGTSADADLTRLDILYGTQTGNAEGVAEEAAAAAKAAGFAPHVAELDDISMEQLAQMQNLLVVISTYGEGEMPDNAGLFWGELTSSTAPRLESMHFSVLALGDTGYDEFCQAGKLMDMRLEQLGAKRVHDRVDCDIDFEEPAEQWTSGVLEVMPRTGGGEAVPQSGGEAKAKKSKWNRKNPYASTILENRLLSGKGSAKEIRHFSFDLGDSELTYEAGDAMGVMPTNDPALVDLFLERLGAKVDDAVEGHDLPLGELLAKSFEISTPSKEFIAEIERRAGHDELSHVLNNGDKEALESFLWGRDTLDLLNLEEGLDISANDFVGLLKPLQHRAYSISSSPKAHPGEVHLTVASVRWTYDNRQHKGVCSTFLADRVKEGDQSGIFMSPNKSFRPPENDDAPMIMVGPGTGIAPFRAFLEERRERGAKGKNWLFFGDQHLAHDFIYQDEIGQMSEDGLINRLDLAFSRDQKEKIYVQTRMKENGKALFKWLEEGGYFYVCGDATRMAKDVDRALAEVIAEHGGLNDDGAQAYVDTLKREKRYLRDVY